jgi:hypothetical protein
MNALANNREEKRLQRLGILEEPMGYVDGANLYEYVGSSPTSHVDPLGLKGEPAQQGSVSGDFTLLDADWGDNLKDPQGTLHLDLSAGNAPKAKEVLQLELKATFKLNQSINTSQLDRGAIFVNGKKVTVQAGDEKNKKGDQSEFKASWHGEYKTDAKCHAEGTVHVALQWKGAINPDPDEKKPNTGVAQSYRIKWQYDGGPGGKGLTGSIEERTDEKRDLPIDKMPDKDGK